jgi:hypothetical protein
MERSKEPKRKSKEHRERKPTPGTKEFLEWLREEDDDV